MADLGPPTTPLSIPEAAAVPSTPSPSASFASSPLRSQMHRPQLPRRQSRFTEDMTGEHTPAPSVYDTASPVEREAAPSMASARSRGGARNGRGPSIYTYRPSHRPSREYRPLELIMRGMNSCIHGAVCVILFAVMVEFLTQSGSSWLGRISAQAVALLVFLGIDTLLDTVSLICLHKQWASWALLLRLACGIAYIILFIAYVSMGHVFPRGYTFWAMSSKFSGPVVYIFLWLLVLWDLSHVALHRQRFGNGMRSCFGPSSSSSPSSHHHSVLPRRSSSTRWRRWIGASDRYSHTRDHDIEVNAHFPRPGPNLNNMSATTVVPSPPTSLRDPNSFAELKRPSFTASFTATTKTMSSQSLPKLEEKPFTSTSGGEAQRGGRKKEEGA